MARRARIGMMLAAALDGWEDRSAVRWRLGKDCRIRGVDLCWNVPAMRGAPLIHGGLYKQEGMK
jgi:hypothetical protein